MEVSERERVGGGIDKLPGKWLLGSMNLDKALVVSLISDVTFVCKQSPDTLRLSCHTPPPPWIDPTLLLYHYYYPPPPTCALQFCHLITSSERGRGKNSPSNCTCNLIPVQRYNCSGGAIVCSIVSGTCDAQTWNLFEKIKDIGFFVFDETTRGEPLWR